MKRRWVILLCGVALLLAWGLRAIRDLGAARVAYVPLEPGNGVVPRRRTDEWHDRSELTGRLLEYWAGRPPGDWKTKGKIEAPRALMGRFLLRRELDFANEYLMSVTPWGTAGSTWALHPEGDYDFTMAGLVPILFLFGDAPEVLYPATRDHLVSVLLPLEGGNPQITVPRSLGLVCDTENHLLMTEGSRYLKNRWLALHGSAAARHDNAGNGLEEWLLKLIEELRTGGLYEFNSIPYEGYTLVALLNLEAFGSATVRSAARELLDELNWAYALGSLDFRRFPPFRRQYAHAGDTSLRGDRHTALMKAWMSLHPDSPVGLILDGSHHIALWACWSPYRLADETARWVARKPRAYFARMGHGPGASPEIYSGGPGWLLTAGGVNRGRRSMVVARPITLLLDDGATDLSQALHLAGPGTSFEQWNNTGVWRNMAVAAGPVQVPDGWMPAAEGGLWKVYARASLCIAVHSRSTLGVVYVAPNADPHAVLSAMETANADADRLRSSFRTQAGAQVEYEPRISRDRWVITQVGGRPVDRTFDHWPRLDEGGEQMAATEPLIGELL